MPELPEVETMRRGVVPVIGRRIAGVTCPQAKRLRPMTIEPRGAALSKRLRGAEVVAAERLAKRVVLRTDRGDRLVFEPRMTGLVLLRDPPTDEHVRLRIALEPARGGARGTAAEPGEVIVWDRRGLGTIRLLDAAAWSALEATIGPDALGVDGDVMRARLGDSRRPIKVALLDQAALAGVGNIYAAEALHRARVHPTRACDSLKPAEWRTLATEVVAILEEAIACKGSTLGDGTYRTADSEDGEFQMRHRVYGREGVPCATCETPVTRIVQAQRATFFCGRCQR